MAGIAGIARQDSFSEVSEMLDRISHRGRSRRKIFETEGTTMGVIWNDPECNTIYNHHDENYVGDIVGPGHYAKVTADNGNFLFARDELGASPLYKGSDSDGDVTFASEVKALLPESCDISEIPPGKNDGIVEYLNPSAPSFPCSSDNPESIAASLRELLDNAVSAGIRTDDTGAWLSGGLDSAAISALAAPYLPALKTFTAGLPGAPDLEFASGMAKFIGAEHHEFMVAVDDLVRILPDVIYYLESFDTLLVRSSVLNFLVAEKASDYVSEIFSGEGADELFAGYEYLKEIPEEMLRDELIRITGKLHNTALQRVDRCASAHGTTAHLVFTNPLVKKFAFDIPDKYKIVNGVEKWILRKAMDGLLPPEVLWRPKAKFWEGAGVSQKLAEIADKTISDTDFLNERVLPNGWILNDKEALFYYRIFREHFGSNLSLSWMGRTEINPGTD